MSINGMPWLFDEAPTQDLGPTDQNLLEYLEQVADLHAPSIYNEQEIYHCLDAFYTNRWQKQDAAQSARTFNMGDSDQIILSFIIYINLGRAPSKIIQNALEYLKNFQQIKKNKLSPAQIFSALRVISIFQRLIDKIFTDPQLKDPTNIILARIADDIQSCLLNLDNNQKKNHLKNYEQQVIEKYSAALAAEKNVIQTEFEVALSNINLKHHNAIKTLTTQHNKKIENEQQRLSESLGNLTKENQQVLAALEAETAIAICTYREKNERDHQKAVRALQEDFQALTVKTEKEIILSCQKTHDEVIQALINEHQLAITNLTMQHEDNMKRLITDYLSQRQAQSLHHDSQFALIQEKYKQESIKKTQANLIELARIKNTYSKQNKTIEQLTHAEKTPSLAPISPAFTRGENPNFSVHHSPKNPPIHGHLPIKQLSIPFDVQYLLNLLYELDLQAYAQGKCVLDLLGDLPSNTIKIIINCEKEKLPSRLTALLDQDPLNNNCLVSGRITLKCDPWGDDLVKFLKQQTIPYHTFIYTYQGYVYDLLNLFSSIQNPRLCLQGDLNLAIQKQPKVMLEVIEVASLYLKTISDEVISILRLHGNELLQLTPRVYLQALQDIFICPYARQKLAYLLEYQLLNIIFPTLAKYEFNHQGDDILQQFWTNKLEDYLQNASYYAGVDAQIVSLFLLLNLWQEENDRTYQVSDIIDDFLNQFAHKFDIDFRHNAIVNLRTLYGEFKHFQLSITNISSYSPNSYLPRYDDYSTPPSANDLHIPKNNASWRKTGLKN